MLQSDRSRAQDLTLRVAGLLLAVLGALSLRYLFHLVHMPPRHDAPLAELALAAIGFIGLSAGGGLITLGAHIFDEIEISPRWARRPLPVPQTERLIRSELLTQLDRHAQDVADRPLHRTAAGWSER